MNALQRCLGALLAACLLASCGGGTDPAQLTTSVGTAGPLAVARAQPAVENGLAVTAILKQSEVRVGRTVFEYVFKISVQNGAQALQGVTARLVGVGPGTTIVDGDVAVGNLAANGTATPADTITLRHDRTLPFSIALLGWQLSGTPVGAVPASVQLTPAQRVVGAGAALPIAATVFDGAGQPITPTPAISYVVTAIPGAAMGALPGTSAGAVTTSANSRGNFLVTGTVAGSAVTSQFTFTVIQNATQSKNSGLYVGLSSALAGSERSLAQLATALQNNDGVAATAAAAALAAAAATVEPNRLSFSTAYEPDLGFVPPASKLTANGLPPGGGDAGYASASAQLRAKLQQITTLLNSPGSDTTANNAKIAQYRNELQAIVNTLATAAATPSPNGVASQAELVSDLLARDVPLLLRAIAARTAAELQAPGGLASRSNASGAPLQPAQFGIGSLLNALGPIGQLVNKIYGEYLQQIQNMVIILIAKDLLDAFVPQVIHINGVLSGAALLGPYAYHYPNSYIDLEGISVAAAQTADVYLIGGAAVNALGGLLGSIAPPSNPKSLDEIYKYFDALIDAIKSVNLAYEQAHQQPNFVISNSFSENFGCLPSLSDNCIEMHYNGGFENVSGGSVSFTVLMLVRNGGPRPQTGSIVLSFAPGT